MGGGGTGEFIKQWGSQGTGPGKVTPPSEHLFVDQSDHVWLVDGEENPRVQKFDRDGNFITSVGSGPCVIEEVKEDPEKMAEPLTRDGKLHHPEHAFTDTEGNLYVIDRVINAWLFTRQSDRGPSITKAA